MTRLALFLLALLALARPAHADDVSASARGVVRVVVIAVEDGQVVGFVHGSGFAVTPNRIVTNAHVVIAAQQYPDNVAIGVVPSEGQRSFAARLISIDRRKDLALIEMTGGTLPPVPLYVGPLADGEDVVALGYPGNVDLATAQSADDYIQPLPPTRSEGNYSNERVIEGIQALLHTAAIARGNSGGPLVDECGRVIGVNTFITRGDDGDSPFGFAISIRELTAFLRGAGQSFTSTGDRCESMEELSRRERELLERQEREQDEAREARERRREEARQRAIAENAELRENILAISLLLGALGLIVTGAGGVFFVKNRTRAGYIAAGLGLVLLVSSAVVFFSRPSLTDLKIENVDPEPEEEESAQSHVGRNVCRIVRDRSRITVSSTEDVAVRWAGNGCVNGRTQYAEEDGVWSRVLVPNGEQAVSVVEFRPDRGEYVVNRYLLGSAAMDRVRQQRQDIGIRACTTDGAKLERLEEKQAEIRSSLPDAPNERLVYTCETQRGED